MNFSKMIVLNKEKIMLPPMWLLTPVCTYFLNIRWLNMTYEVEKEKFHVLMKAF